MAPEQCRGHAFDRRADVFSLGVILFELITARRLFWADNDVASLHKVLSGNVPDPRTLVPSLPPELGRVMLAAVAPEAGARLATTAVLADALEAHAARAGIATGARAIARSMHDVLGTRSAPWIEVSPPATRSIAEVEPDEEPSLVSVIESLAEPPEEPLGSDFVIEAEASPQVSAEPPPPSRRRVVPIVIGLSAIAVVAITLVIARTGNDEVAPAPEPRPTPAAVAPAPPPPAPPSVPAVADPITEPAIEIEEAAQPSEKRRRKRPPAAVPVDAGITATSPRDAATGSGGRTVEWTPTMLLPTDKKKPESK
jgi:serine/threonine-protein kinase